MKLDCLSWILHSMSRALLYDATLPSLLHVVLKLDLMKLIVAATPMPRVRVQQQHKRVHSCVHAPLRYDVVSSTFCCLAMLLVP